MARYNIIWKNIFVRLFEKEIQHPLWTQFWNISIEEIKDCFEHSNFDNFPDAKQKFSELISHSDLISNSKDLINEMKKEAFFDDNIWRTLVLIIRNRKVQPLDNNKTLLVKMGGYSRHMNNEELEEQLLEDMPNLMSSQISIPEYLVFDQAEDLENKHLRQIVKMKYKKLVKQTKEDKKNDIEEMLSNKRVELVKKKTENLEDEIDKLREKELEKLEKEKKTTEKQNLVAVAKCFEASTLQKRRADESEVIVQHAILEPAEHHEIPMTILQGIKTYEHTAQFLTDLGVQCSVFGKKETEVEHDVIVVAALQTGLAVTFIQVKTSEDKIPWVPDPENQVVSSDNVQKGMDQLERDCLRLLEMFPEIEITKNISINFKLAFPLASRSKSNDSHHLTKEDFEKTNGDALLAKLGIPAKNPDDKPPPSVCEVYKKVIARYIGSHSTIPLKTASEALSHGLSALNLHRRCTESVIQSQIEEIEEHHNLESESIKRTIERDPLMKDIKLALENRAYCKKFEKTNSIQLKELKPEKASSGHFITDKKGMHPIYGEKLVIKIIKQVDDLVSHQGAIHIMKYFEGKKMNAFDENGGELNLEMAIENHIKKCEDCIDVNQLKSQNKKEGRLTHIKNDDIPDLLKYADKKHLGFEEAYKRIKWSDFPEFKSKLKVYISECHQCASRKAWLLLSPQQREAIRTRSPLKIITGQYGSGKTTVGRLLCERECSQFDKTSAIFVSFSRSSDGTELKNMFKTDFLETEKHKLEVLSRTECCQKFKVQDTEDNIEVIHNVINVLDPYTCIMFDETPLASVDGRKAKYDWSHMRNNRSDVSVIVSLQPIRQHPTLLPKLHKIHWPDSTDVNVVELNTQYRNTKNIHKFNSMLYKEKVPVEYAHIESNPCETVWGPDISIIDGDEIELVKVKHWILYQLEKMNCTKDHLKIIHTENTRNEAEEMFGNTKFKSCITTIEKFQGCESSVVIVIYNTGKNVNFSTLIDMTTRANYKLYVIMKEQRQLLNSLEDFQIANQEAKNLYHTDPEAQVRFASSESMRYLDQESNSNDGEPFVEEYSSKLDTGLLEHANSESFDTTSVPSGNKKPQQSHPEDSSMAAISQNWSGLDLSLPLPVINMESSSQISQQAIHSEIIRRNLKTEFLEATSLPVNVQTHRSMDTVVKMFAASSLSSCSWKEEMGEEGEWLGKLHETRSFKKNKSKVSENPELMFHIDV